MALTPSTFLEDTDGSELSERWLCEDPHAKLQRKV